LLSTASTSSSLPVVIDGLDEFLAVDRFLILNISWILIALLGALMHSVVSAGHGAAPAAQGSCPAKQ
jgi:hypothetical protein